MPLAMGIDVPLANFDCPFSVFHLSSMDASCSMLPSWREVSICYSVVRLSFLHCCTLFASRMPLLMWIDISVNIQQNEYLHLLLENICPKKSPESNPWRISNCQETATSCQMAVLLYLKTAFVVQLFIWRPDKHRKLLFNPIHML